jgi:hypothetical protein
VAVQEAPQEKTLTCSTTSKHEEKFRLTAAPRPLELGKLAYAVMQRGNGKAFGLFKLRLSKLHMCNLRQSNGGHN